MNEHMTPCCSNRIDLVTTVRCKDCRFGWTNTITGNVYCQRDGRHSYEMVFDPDAFCSYGKPRESKEE